MKKKSCDGDSVFQDTVVERTCCNMYAKCFGEDGHRGDHGSPGRKVRICWVWDWEGEMTFPVDACR